LGENRLHISELLLKRSQHLFTHLELHCSRMVLNRKRILAQVLYEHLILPLVLALTHLEDHVLVCLLFLAAFVIDGR
jgi:hypothetical protein